MAVGFLGREIGKAIAKFGSKSVYDAVRKYKPRWWDFEGRSLKKQALLQSDERINHLVTAPHKIDLNEAIQELPRDQHVSAEYVKRLLDHVSTKEDIRVIIRYIRSTAAGNLSPNIRAEILMKAVEKLKWVDVISQFLH